MITATLCELDEFIGRHSPEGYEFPFEEKLFNKLEEKMVIELTLKLLQNRQVRIPPVAGAASDKF